MSEMDPPNDRWLGIPMLVARGVVGGRFLYLAYKKIVDIPGFAKVLNEYAIIPRTPPWILNGTATYLPFLEVVLGLAVLLGFYLRSTFLLLLGMLVFFTLIVYGRGGELAVEEAQSFCDVAFDCGCGTGKVNVCWKLAENSPLIVLCGIGVVSASRRYTLDRWRRDRKTT